ncbi:AAA family ATPase [Deinococcus sp. HMF7620]|uniref:AAA family ATPase n=1 Tax=Deinococcus arboris TaxID=2682977 RepID=A0A7C9IA42_9DEIO|nr:TniB family NTP-binding protein [Deinococcus arboris]MVN86566.1 AAA family ATPase [Deinococcus arboris]
MSSEFSHLHESVVPVMRASDAVRLKHLEAARWLSYPRAQELLAHMTYLLEHTRVDRMPNLLIVGETNSGKTQIAKRFRHLFPAVHHPDLARTLMPVVYLQTPAVPDEGKFYNELLDVFQAPYRPQDHSEKKRKLAFHHLERAETRLLIIDEIHNGLAGRTSANRQFMISLRYLSNSLQLPLVAVGTQAALRAMQVDDQLSNRFEPLALPRWNNDDAWRTLIKRYEQTLPLQRPSRLHSRATADYLHFQSEGLLGELALTLKAAARKAIQSKVECIDLSLLQELKRPPPSERRGAAEKLLR